MHSSYRKLILLSFILGLVLLLNGCAQLTQMERDRTCSNSAAYAAGMNDARQNATMRSNYAKVCTTNQAALNEAYADGYTKGIGARDTGRSRRDNWICIDSFAKQVCGYGCIKDPFNKVYCGSHRRDNCVKNVFNKVRCGEHCRIDQFNKIHCEKERYSKTSARPK